jgi:hypothetical protein
VDGDLEAAQTSDSEFMSDFQKNVKEISVLIKSFRRIVEELDTKCKDRLNKIDSEQRKGNLPTQIH